MVILLRTGFAAIPIPTLEKIHASVNAALRRLTSLHSGLPKSLNPVQMSGNLTGLRSAMHNRIHSFTVLVLYLFAIATTALAQVDRATLNGTVTDASGAVVQNVKIELDSPATGLHRETATNSRSEERRVGKECRSRWSP